MKVLAVDPSSTAIGWAVCEDPMDPVVVSSGVIRRPESWPSPLRTRSMVDEYAGVLESAVQVHMVDRVVVETPGTAQTKRRSAEGSTTPIQYILCVGAVLQASWSYATHIPVVSVQSDHWTRWYRVGRRMMSKDERLRRLELTTSYSREDGDAGGDRGDSISLGTSYLIRHGREELKECLLHLPAKKIGKSKTYSHGNVAITSGGAVAPVGSRLSMS